MTPVFYPPMNHKVYSWLILLPDLTRSRPLALKRSFSQDRINIFDSYSEARSQNTFQAKFQLALTIGIILKYLYACYTRLFPPDIFNLQHPAAY